MSVIVYLAVMVLLLSWMLGVFQPPGDGLLYSDVLELFRQEQVKSFVVRDGVGRQDKSSDVIVDGERYDRAFYAHTQEELMQQSEGIFAFEQEMPDAEPSIWRNYVFVKP